MRLVGAILAHLCAPLGSVIMLILAIKKRGSSKLQQLKLPVPVGELFCHLVFTTSELYGCGQPSPDNAWLGAAGVSRVVALAGRRHLSGIQVPVVPGRGD